MFCLKNVIFIGEEIEVRENVFGGCDKLMKIKVKDNYEGNTIGDKETEIGKITVGTCGITCKYIVDSEENKMYIVGDGELSEFDEIITDEQKQTIKEIIIEEGITSIKDNVIDNNNLGLGIYGGSNGLIISDNTIEGNRNYTTGVGCGILLKGNNHSRCKISGNWFEANGSTQGSVDVFLGAGSSTTHADAIALWNNIVDNCVPDNYKSELSSGQLSVGAIDLSNNAHIFTKVTIAICD